MDDDVEILAETISLRDPFTTLRIRDPCISVRCQDEHPLSVMEREAAETFIENARKARASLNDDKRSLLYRKIPAFKCPYCKRDITEQPLVKSDFIAEVLSKSEQAVQVFLMNDSVYLTANSPVPLLKLPDRIRKWLQNSRKPVNKKRPLSSRLPSPVRPSPSRSAVTPPAATAPPPAVTPPSVTAPSPAAQPQHAGTIPLATLLWPAAFPLTPVPLQLQPPVVPASTEPGAPSTAPPTTAPPAKTSQTAKKQKVAKKTAKKSLGPSRRGGWDKLEDKISLRMLRSAELKIQGFARQHHDQTSPAAPKLAQFWTEVQRSFEARFGKFEDARSK
jgi:hypothetical protein